MKETEPEAVDAPLRAPEVVQGPRPEAAGPGAAHPDLLRKLQRSVGNRAVAGLVESGRLRAPARRTLARAPVQVRQTASEPRVGGGTFGGSVRFDVDFSAFEATITVKVKLVPASGVSAADVTAVQATATAAFLNMWDNRFLITDQASHDQFFLRVNVQFVATGQHFTVALHPGNGRMDETNWSVGASPTDFAHELTHKIGPNDEYVDPTAVRRRTATSPGVFTDHSVMGNYPTEGAGLAEAKLRHAQEVADRIGRASSPHRHFTAAYTLSNQGERLVRWRGIRDSLAAGSTQRAAAAAEVTAIEADLGIPQLSGLTGVPYAPTP
jgi:hypothetical protein